MKKLALMLALLIALSALGAVVYAEEPTTIRFFGQDFVNAPLTNDTPTIQALEEALNIQLDLNLTSGSSADYEEKYNLMLASGDYPDIIAASASQANPYLDTGIFLELTDILPEKMPNVYKMMEEYGVMKDAKSDDGKLWYVPKLEGATTFWEICWINQAWMDELGLQTPTNTDELYEVLKAFKEAKGDDCIPMTMGPWAERLQDMYVTFHTYNNWFMYSEETGMQYGPYDLADGMRACLTYLNKLYSEGLLDAEYLTRDDDSINALIANNQTGYFFEWADDADRLIEGGTLGVNYTFVPPIAGPDGFSGWYTGSPLSVRFYINAASPNLDKVYEFFDYIYSDEGRNLFTWGIEGVTYEVVDGEKQYTEAVMTHESGKLTGRRIYGINPVQFPHVSEWEGWAKVVSPYCVEIAETTADTVLPIQPALSGTADEETELANLMQDIKKYVDSQLPLFVNGTLSVEDDYDAFLEQLEKMGIKDAKAIKDAQFDRWSNR